MIMLKKAMVASLVLGSVLPMLFPGEPSASIAALCMLMLYTFLLVVVITGPTRT